MNRQPSVSVIMPALNEERNVASSVENVLTTFERLNIQGEVIVVNDGSKDRTPEIIRELEAQFPNVRSIHHKKPHGLGASFWEGAHSAKCEVVTMLPGDAENDAHEILRYLPLMQDVDLVIPFVYNNEVRTLPRRLLSKFYKGIINLSFGMLLNYMNGTVMYRRNVLTSLKLKSTGFFYQTELLIRSLHSGYLYAEVPYKLKQRLDGKSKATTLKSLIRLSKDYILLLWNIYGHRNEGPSYDENTATAMRRLKGV